MRSSRIVPLLLATAAAAACSSEDTTRTTTAYDTLDSCSVYADEETCLANADRCVWYGLGMPCVEGEPCVSGVCQDIDPCRVHTDVDSCAADTDNRCAWAEVELCPGDDCGDGGFCYQMTDDQDCTCVCPLGPCSAGEECPPCQCDCPDDDGGNTCTCTGTVCPDGDPDCVPEPVECTCDGGGGGGDGCGTCTCTGTVCPEDDPDCVPDPIECECEGTAGAGAPTYEENPCMDYADEEACAADPLCAWVQDPCPLCPDCAPGVDCEPCTCDETFSCWYVGDSGCAEPGSGGGGSSGGAGGSTGG